MPVPPNTPNALAQIVDALAFAAEKHRLQRRKDADATPYINHPIELTHILVHEAGFDDATVIVAAILHDTVEDTHTTLAELTARFGDEVSRIVAEVTDDKSLPKEERKRQQELHAPHASFGAQRVKLADEIANVRDLSRRPPASWGLERKRAYFDWAKRVVDGMRGKHPELEALFDAAYQARP